jgi:multisubunit Na+/H+ antiporter MnhC subunit
MVYGDRRGRGMMSTDYGSLAVNTVCRAMILAAIAIGICAMPIYAVWAICDARELRLLA